MASCSNQLWSRVFSRPVPTCVPWPGYAHNITPGKNSFEDKCACLRCVCVCDLMSLQWRLVQISTSRIEMVSVRYVTDGSEGGVSNPYGYYDDACSWKSVLV